MSHEKEVPPYRIISGHELESKRSPKGTIALEGHPYGSGVSLFLIEYHEPGEGPLLHKHPYPETWIVRSGEARFTVDGHELDAGSGDVVVVPGETPHKFKNLGPDPLDIICIHPSPRFIQEDLE